MVISEAMNIPAAAATQPAVSTTGFAAPQQLQMPTIVTRGDPSGAHHQQRPRNVAQLWAGPSWPMAGSSVQRGVAMGTSPYGKSVDMVDVCGLMEAGTAAPPLSSTRVPSLRGLLFVRG